MFLKNSYFRGTSFVFVTHGMTIKIRPKYRQLGPNSLVKTCHLMPLFDEANTFYICL